VRSAGDFMHSRIEVFGAQQGRERGRGHHGNATLHQHVLGSLRRSTPRFFFSPAGPVATCGDLVAR